jgi:hypothetical protein
LFDSRNKCQGTASASAVPFRSKEDGFSHWLHPLELCSLSAYILYMKRLMFATAFFALCAFSVAPVTAEKQPVLVVHGPTVVAFFEPVPQAKLDKDPDANESLADFQLYATRVRAPLRKVGIEFHELYTHSFRLRVGNRLTTVRPINADVGYYLVVPGKKPRIEYGVMTDADLLQVANEYFGNH